MPQLQGRAARLLGVRDHTPRRRTLRQFVGCCPLQRPRRPCRPSRRSASPAPRDRRRHGEGVRRSRPPASRSSGRRRRRTPTRAGVSRSRLVTGRKRARAPHWLSRAVAYAHARTDRRREHHARARRARTRGAGRHGNGDERQPCERGELVAQVSAAELNRARRRPSTTRCRARRRARSSAPVWARRAAIAGPAPRRDLDECGLDPLYVVDGVLISDQWFGNGSNSLTSAAQGSRTTRTSRSTASPTSVRKTSRASKSSRGRRRARFMDRRRPTA